MNAAYRQCNGHTEADIDHVNFSTVRAGSAAIAVSRFACRALRITAWEPTLCCTKLESECRSLSGENGVAKFEGFFSRFHQVLVADDLSRLIEDLFR
jgi:hypothetical protein